MPYRVAAVSFLNTVPLIEYFVAGRCPSVNLEVALPRRVAELLAADDVDAGLVPVVEILRGGLGGILSPTGIACDGPVDSVALFASGPLPALGRVLVDRGSRSSVALLRVLLAELHGVRPDFQVAEAVPGRRLDPGEGMLFIGDRCLAEHAVLRRDNPQHLATHDLGAMWKELTGLPFVFAAWTAGPGFFAEAGDQGVRRLGGILTEARDFGLSRLEAIAEREAAAGSQGHGGEATPVAIAYYFRNSLRFRLGESEILGLKKFQAYCIEHGLAPAGPAPRLPS